MTGAITPSDEGIPGAQEHHTGSIERGIEMGKIRNRNWQDSKLRSGRHRPIAAHPSQ
jgi:hypothetical protein